MDISEKLDQILLDIENMSAQELYDQMCDTGYIPSPLPHVKIREVDITQEPWKSIWDKQIILNNS